MIESLFEALFNPTFASVGAGIGVLLIMFVLFLGMLYCGLEFDYALVILSPIPYAFNVAGYLDTWITATFIIIPLGIGIYSIWVKFNNKQ
jgi:hypothetical protein